MENASCSVWNLLYRTLISNKLPISTVAFTGDGKPYFIDLSICFSLSHSCGLFAIAVADRPVGVDIEICKGSYKMQMIERLLCEEEMRFDGDFTRIRSRKEAVVKMVGEGITGFSV